MSKIACLTSHSQTTQLDTDFTGHEGKRETKKTQCDLHWWTQDYFIIPMHMASSSSTAPVSCLCQ